MESAGPSSNVAKSQKVRQELVTMLAHEVLRDGGASLATWLCQLYDQRIPQCLRQLHGPSLLEVLHEHPDVFFVSLQGRTAIIQLASNWKTHVPAIPELSDKDPAVLAASAKLQESSMWALQQRTAKWQRRMQSKSGSQDSVSTLKPDPVQSLLRKVEQSVHLLMRLLPSSRPDGCMPFSEDWRSAAVPFLVEFLSERASIFSMTLISGEYGADGARSLGVTLVAAPSCFSQKELHDICGLLKTMFFAAGLARSGSIGMNLGRACEHMDMQRLLQGRSLQEALSQEPLATEFQCYQDDTRNGAWQIRVAKTLISNDSSSLCSRAHLLADEVGLFSMSGKRDAKAIASGLAKLFTRTTGQAASSEGGVCVDMTAGIGGITLALARTFHSVKAYEIDASRFEYLQKNLAHAGLIDNVECLCSDSLQALVTSGFQRRSRQVYPAAILDPPWGGVNYKRSAMRQSLQFAGLPLSEVVLQLVGKVSVLAIKLPMLFNIGEFIASLPRTAVDSHSNSIISRTRVLYLTLSGEASHDLCGEAVQFAE